MLGAFPIGFGRPGGDAVEVSCGDRTSQRLMVTATGVYHSI
jgi:hypothetical protein